MTSADNSVTTSGRITFLRGRFEARFEDEDAARAAARDARATAFVVDVRQDGADSWLIVGRQRLAFPADERDRYVRRLSLIATRHRGAFSQFVEEPLEPPMASPTD
jgi:hypothetical protein